MQNSVLLLLFRKSLFAVFGLLLLSKCFAQDCNTQAANKPATYSPNFQNVLNPAVKTSSSNINKMKLQLAKVESWMRSTLKDFTGAKLMYGNYYLPDPDTIFTQMTGLKASYQGIMMFFSYYCNENKNIIETEGESGSNLQVDINSIFGVDPFFSSDIGVVKINGKPVFTVLEKNNTEGRIDYYDLRKRMTFADTIFTSKTDYFLIRNSDQPVYIAITRREYLQQLLTDFEANRLKEINAAKQAYTPQAEAANKANFDEALNRIDHSKNSTPEQMAPYRKRFIETWETEKQKFEKRTCRAETEATKSKDILLEYLKKPAEWLNRGFGSFCSDSYLADGLKYYLDRLDVFSEVKEDYTRSEIVAINPRYFDKTLTADVPQLLLVTVHKNGYRYMHKLSDLVKTPGSFAPLEAILLQGKNTVKETLISPSSSHKVSFLPKLNTPVPPVVPTGQKPSVVAVLPVSNTWVNTFNFELPALTYKIKQLMALRFTAEAYKKYVADLQSKMIKAIKPEIKKKADDYVKNKKLVLSKDISNTALTAWLQNALHQVYIYTA